MPAGTTPGTWLVAGTLAIGLLVGAVTVANGQSQEPKPSLPATPVEQPDVPIAATPVSGVEDGSWTSPTWDVSISWDPAIWSLENELIDDGYDGLQIGTPASTVFIEAYDGFAGDADACLADAEREINEREQVREVAPLDGRPLPDTGADAGPARLFGLVATLDTGETIRGTEYVECRTLVSGEAVLELTWQTSAAAYNDELPLVDALFAALSYPSETPGSGPLLPAPPPELDPNTASSWPGSSPPVSASAK